MLFDHFGHASLYLLGCQYTLLSKACQYLPQSKKQEAATQNAVPNEGADAAELVLDMKASVYSSFERAEDEQTVNNIIMRALIMGSLISLAPEVGLEPTTKRLTAARSTTELLGIID